MHVIYMHVIARNCMHEYGITCDYIHVITCNRLLLRGHYLSVVITCMKLHVMVM
jgi:hypothetical protein